MIDILAKNEKTQEKIGFLESVISNKEIKLQDGNSIKIKENLVNKLKNWNSLGNNEKLGFLTSYFENIDIVKASAASIMLYSDLNSGGSKDEAVEKYLGFYLRNNKDALNSIDNINTAIKNTINQKTILGFYLTAKEMSVTDTDIEGFTQLGNSVVLTNHGNFSDKTLEELVKVVKAPDTSIFSNDNELKDYTKAILYTSANDFTEIDSALNTYLTTNILSPAELTLFKNDLLQIMKAKIPEVVSTNIKQTDIDTFLENILVDKTSLLSADVNNIRDPAYLTAGKRINYTMNALKVYETMTKLNGKQ